MANPTVANQVAANVAEMTNMAIQPAVAFYGSGDWTYSPNGTGGVNYFRNSAPVTNTQYARATGQDTGTIEANIKDAYGRNNIPANNNIANNNIVNNTPNYSVINANALAQLGQSEGVINNSLNRLDGQLGIALGNIDTTYNQRVNELNSKRSANENSYNTSTTQNRQSFRTNKNTINDQASQGLRGLRRLLGSYGAVGSDMGLAGQAVTDVASAQNAGAGQNFSQNQQALDTNWGNYKNEWDNEKRNTDDWRSQQRNSAEASSKSTRQDLLSKLADIRGQQAQARGGSYAAGAQPYIDQANALSARIDELGRLNPTYTGVTPTYTAPTLASYSTGNGAVTRLKQQAAGGLNTPYLNALLGNDKKKTLGF